MTLQPALSALLIMLCMSRSAYSQCTTNQISVSGNMCVGSELQLISNNLPSSVSWSLSGNILAVQTTNFDNQGTTVAGGNGPGSNTNQLNNPDRLYVDATGAIYIPDLKNNRIQKWLPGATVGITVAGGNGSGNAANQFNRPTSVHVDGQGAMYVTDQANRRVQKWVAGASTGVTVAGLNNELSYPTDLFVDGSGNLYVSDQYNNVVLKYAPGSLTGVVVAGDYSFGAGPTALNGPTGIFVDANGNLFVCDTDNQRLQKWAAGASSGTTIAFGSYFLDVCVDCSGKIFVADYSNNRIVKYGPGGTVIVAGGNGQGTGANQLYNPNGVFLTEKNELYVADYNNHRVQRFLNTIIDPRFTPTMPGIYTVTANYNCCPSVSNTFEVFNGSIPEVNITATNTTICPGEEVKFYASNVNSVTSPGYQWKLNGANVGTNSDQFQSVTLENNDNLLCILTSPNACKYKLYDTSNVIQLKIVDTIPPDLGKDLSICPGSDTVLKVASSFNSYIWQDNSTGPALQVNTPGKYYVTVKDNCNRSLSDTIAVSHFKPDNHILPADTIICSYDSLVLKPVKISLTNLWSNQTTNNSLVVYQPGEYWLQAQDENNCTVRDSIYIDTKNCPPRGIYVPNAFTPDNNGVNDLLKPVVYGKIKKYRFAVFNRYGQMVFSATDPQKGWNGSVNGNLPNAGVYVWYCTYELEGQKSKTEKGAVVLIK